MGYMDRIRIHITGIVQGVGFRPFVYREAVVRGLTGWVLNAGDGVHIEASGERSALDDFVRALGGEAPAAARVDRITVEDVEPERSTRHQSHEATQNEPTASPALTRNAPNGAPCLPSAMEAPYPSSPSSKETGGTDPARFRIIASDDSGARTTLVSSDIATCPDCLRELFDPADRRYHYPFINCTNCGPRYTIIRRLPYDRPRTSMAAFPMCDACAAEYTDPLDRRFHAQPDACFDCGPHLTWRESQQEMQSDKQPCATESTVIFTEARPATQQAAVPSTVCAGAAAPSRADEAAGSSIRQTPVVGRTREESDAIIARCADLLADGRIIAIKGLGGFHLACNAADERAVAELRRRKRRSNKPLAVMVRTLADAEALCQVNDRERELLTGTVRPIVLLRRHGGEAATSSDDNDAAPITAPGEARAQQPEPLADPAKCSSCRETDGAPDPIPTTAGRIAPGVVGDLPEIGIMLPYTPLQHLLLAACGERGVTALVMTSGNVSEEPIETDDGLAWHHLVEGGLADALLGNNRAILARFDDSVVRVVGGATQMVRRARGYAPRPIALPSVATGGANRLPSSARTRAENAARSTAVAANRDGHRTLPAAHDAVPAPAILACGPEQKATLALTRELDDGTAECLVSQHIGDLENAETFDAWQACRMRMQELFDIAPAALACDRHPSYLSSQWARAEAEEQGLPLIEVQHHHAHIASVIAEAAAWGDIAPDTRVIGIALDGTGAGDDGTIWGGEILVADLASAARAAHLRRWPLPGGAAAVRDARRSAYGLLYAYELLDHPGAQPLLAAMTEQERALTQTMIERNLNCPLTSSMGRFLDAVATLLGICNRATYEGEPAIELEAAATRWTARGCAETAAPQAHQAPAQAVGEPGGETTPHAPVSAATTKNHPARRGTGCNPPGTPDPQVIDFSGLLAALLDGMARGEDSDALARAAHDAATHTIARVAAAVAQREGIGTVALSGGCFMNRLLFEGLSRRLAAAGLTVLVPHEVPVNDGCIAYGQAAIARAQLACRHG